jgi:hypothetical protein
MVADTATTAQVIDTPASFHNGACSFSFAMHSEVHKWKGPGMKKGLNATPINNYPVTDALSVSDVKWWCSVTTVKK